MALIETYDLFLESAKKKEVIQQITGVKGLFQWSRGERFFFFKKGKKLKNLKYRPVSLTAVVCKLLVRIIRSQGNIFLNGRNYANWKKNRIWQNLILSHQFIWLLWSLLKEREGWSYYILLNIQKEFDTSPQMANRERRISGQCTRRALRLNWDTWVRSI